ncbi:hypothetical protein Dimus_020425, partial [Dionaea muscipula]
FAHVGRPVNRSGISGRPNFDSSLSDHLVVSLSGSNGRPALDTSVDRLSDMLSVRPRVCRSKGNGRPGPRLSGRSASLVGTRFVPFVSLCFPFIPSRFQASREVRLRSLGVVSYD